MDYLQLNRRYSRGYKGARIRESLPEKKVARYYQLENKMLAAINYEIAGKIPFVR